MKAGRAQCPACFFCFLARETSLFFERRPFFSSEGPPLFRVVHSKTFSTHVRAQFATRVRKTGLSTHARSTRPDMGPRSRGALTRNTLAYLRLFAGMGFMFSKFYIFVTYSCFDYSLKEY